MVKSADTFTVAQAALALKLSPKRIRQMFKEGKLTPLPTEPVTISQLEVLEMRVKRESVAVDRDNLKTRSKESEINAALLAQFAALIEQNNATTQRTLELMQTTASTNEANLIGQINDLRAENERLRARKGFFRR